MTRSRSSAARPPDFEVDSFDVSYGDPQTVAVTAKRAIKHLELNYKINNGKTKTADVSEWRAASATATRTTTTTASSAAR